MNGMVLTDNLSILTGQIIQFSAEKTTDNVPLSHLEFSWDWGDGNLEGGKGVTRAYHMWEDGLTAVTSYNLTLTVSDGVNSASETIEIIVNNRAPGQIFTNTVVTETFTATMLPDVFEDVDGEIVGWNWVFEEAVNLDGGIVDRTNLFVDLLSTEQNPMVAWSTPGIKNVNITVTDNDGGTVCFTTQSSSSESVASSTIRGQRLKFSRQSSNRFQN